MRKSTIKKVFVIARNTFTETVRDKILYGIFAFALITIIGVLLIGSLSLGDDVYIVRSLGLAGIYVFSLIITVFIGASLVYKELEKKTIYLLLSKPVSHGNVVLGKYFGLFASVIVITSLMLLVYLGVVLFSGGGFDYHAILAVFLQYFELGLLIALLILFSIFSTPLAATIYTIIVLYIGHLLSLFSYYASHTGGIYKVFLIVVYYIFPNLEKFNIRNMVVHDMIPSGWEILYIVLYGSIYIVLALYLSVILLKRREL